MTFQIGAQMPSGATLGEDQSAVHEFKPVMACQASRQSLIALKLIETLKLLLTEELRIVATP
jgi:hypothetical protein